MNCSDIQNTDIHSCCFYVCLIVDKDANPSTKVHRNGTTSSDKENVITVEVNNKYETGHTMLIAKSLSLHFDQFVLFFKLFRKAIFWTATIKAPMVITKK